MKSSPHKIGIVTWDYGEGRGGLGMAMQWAAKALGSRAQVLRVPRLCLRVRGRDRGWRHAILPVGPGGPLLLCLPDVPYTALCYHTYADQAACVPGEGWKRIFIPYERRVLLHAERILCYAQDTVLTLEKFYGLPSQKIMLLPQLFDCEDWKPTESVTKDPFLVVCVARLERRKGVCVLLRAWENVHKSCPEAQLIIVGKGRLRAAPYIISSTAPPCGFDCTAAPWKGAADVCGVTNIPFLPRPELRVLVQRASVAICPSYLEGFGLSCAEAMAAGTAVIASDVPGLRSLIRHGETGLLVPAGDSDALADATALLLHDVSLRRRLEANAFADVHSRFQWQNACEALYAGVA